jgi:hypothetical protein
MKSYGADCNAKCGVCEMRRFSVNYINMLARYSIFLSSSYYNTFIYLSVSVQCCSSRIVLEGVGSVIYFCTGFQIFIWCHTSGLSLPRLATRRRSIYSHVKRNLKKVANRWWSITVPSSTYNRNMCGCQNPSLRHTTDQLTVKCEIPHKTLVYSTSNHTKYLWKHTLNTEISVLLLHYGPGVYSVSKKNE